MSWQIPRGTPTRAGKYQTPARRLSAFGTSVLVASLMAIVLAVFYFLGVRRTLSPGDVAMVHAPIDMRCVQCHQEAHNVVDLRCERCHDAAGTNRLTNASHVLFGSRNQRKSERAPMVACVTCHVDHQGRTHKLTAVDDRECATCHSFSTLRRHPEFAVVRAATTSSHGMKFPHDIHITAVRKQSGSDCQYCHAPTTDRIGFEPIVFDRHCASCHTKNGFITGETEPLPAAEILLSEAVSPPLQSRPVITAGARQRVVASGLRHRDSWVVLNALRLWRAIDSDGLAAERASLRAQKSQLEQQLAIQPLAAIPSAQLGASIDGLSRTLSDLDRRIAAQESPGQDGRALAALAATTQGLARQLASVDPTGAMPAFKVDPVDNGKWPADPAAQQHFNDRKAELLKLLDAIGRRDPSRKGAADALRARVAQLQFKEGSRPELAPLMQRLADLDDVLGAIGAIPDGKIQSEVAQTELVRQFARQVVGRGLSADDFEARKAEIAGLLDDVERRGGDLTRLRVNALRQRLATLRPGTYGIDALSRERWQTARFIERLRLEQELDRAGERIAPLPIDTGASRADAGALLQRVSLRLDELDRAPRRTVATSTEERNQLASVLDSLLVPCLKCHELSGARLAPVRLAEPVLVRSVFTHAPHVTQVDCESCHSAARRSKRSADVLVPGVAQCQTCHNSSQASTDCESCHRYHPRSIASLVRLP